MIDKEILKDECIAIPIVNHDSNCKEMIDTRLIQFTELLRRWEVDDNLICQTHEFRENLSKMYKEYFLGHQNSAYRAFRDALRGQTKEIGIKTTALPNEFLYRARKNEGNLDYGNNEMFHIKYDERGKVQTQRFSFPGLPCLYLGGSSYVCWMELNRPPFDQFQVATIRQKNPDASFNVIDLCLHPQALYNDPIFNDVKGEDAKQIILTYLQWWPVIAASSIAVKNEDDPFKPEYIFPQFMLQYLLEEMKVEECIGIKYMSIKVGKVSMKQYESDYRTYTNYAIPIRTTDDEAQNGFCGFLEREFEIVRNFSGRELQVLTDSIRESGVVWEDWDKEEPKHLLDDAELFGTNDVSYSYEKSVFYRIETILENEKLDVYNDEGKMVINPISIEKIKDLFD